MKHGMSKLFHAKVVLGLALAVLAAMLVPAAAFASEQFSAGSPQDDAALAPVQASVSTQASASPKCALLCKDGNLWRCTSKGKPVSKFWDRNKSLTKQFNKVRTVFIASDVKSVTSSFYAWTRYTRITGKKDDKRISMSFSGLYLDNVNKVKFLTNTSGVSKCKRIGEGAFNGASSIKKVINLNKTKITQIGQRAFYESSVTKLSLPKTLKTIGNYAFYKCGALTTVSGLNKTKLSSLGTNAFNYCEKLKSVSLPNTCKEVNNYAFANCTSLKSVSLGEKTSVVDENAFLNCEKLASVALPETCEELGRSAFSGCSSLSKATMPSKSVVTNADGAKLTMTSVFEGSPIEEEGSDAYIYVPESLLEDYSSDRLLSPWYHYHTKFRAL